MTPRITVIGGGLAGSEAAWQIAQRDIDVLLCEMRPAQTTPAHATDLLAELICSNSLGSSLPDRATGLLQNELRHMGSLLLQCAGETAVPAGGALAVDRTAFAEQVTARIEAHPRIELMRGEVTEMPGGIVIVATGPLTSDTFSSHLASLTGADHLYFFDALAPIVRSDSVDMSTAFRASRYDRDRETEGDYINCPFDKAEYLRFVEALVSAERQPLREFEKEIDDGVKAGKYFEGCLPVEVLAGRGTDSLAFGPMRPVGLTDPRTGQRPWAVVQLRQDNLAGSLLNIVGFQTNLKYGEQERVFRLIPGLQDAVFVRYGQMHRNTFISSPALLDASMQFRTDPRLFFAGQITGIEGYVGNIGSGLLAGLNAARHASGQPPVAPPATTMLGALVHYISHAEPDSFQPMKANFGILPALDDGKRRGKRDRYKAYAERAMSDMQEWLEQSES